MSDVESDDDVIVLPPSPGSAQPSSSSQNLHEASSPQRINPAFRSFRNIFRHREGQSLSQRLSITDPPLPSLEGTEINPVILQQQDTPRNTGLSANQEVLTAEDNSRDSDVEIDSRSEANSDVLEPEGEIQNDSSDAETLQPSSPPEPRENVPAQGTSTNDGTPTVPVSVVDSTPQNTTHGEATGTPRLPGPSVVQTLATNLDSPADFRSPKRRRVEQAESTSTSIATTTTSVDEDEDDANCCPICFDEWTTSGSHRLSSLRCGHLFGHSCIDKWLRGQGGKCPQCNAKAKRQDIRPLYAKSIKAVDTSERDRALQELEKEKEARRRCEIEAAQTRLQFQLSVEECNRLKAELDRVRQTVQSLRSQSASGVPQTPTSPTKQSQARLNGQFLLEKTIKIWEAGNCRVMDFSTSLATLAVSQPSSSPLFPGFGIKKISTMDFKTSQYLTLHTKAIRDIRFHPLVDDGILLSASMDKTVKMTSVISNAVVQSYETPQPVWSCVWNTDDRNYFYSGQSNGNVLEFDIRNTSGHLRELNTEGHRSPVVSLEYIPRDPQAIFRPGGLLVGQLAQVSFYEHKSDDQYRLHMLPLDGTLSSLCFEPSTRNLLASFKPNSKYPTTRHQMCEMSSTNINVGTDNMCSCNVIQTFHGGRTQAMLSRSLLLPHPIDNSRLLICAGEEESSAMHIWDCGSGQMSQRLHMGGVVVDICAIRGNQQTFVAALTEKQVKVHRWN